jgi:hypothetical protein
MGRPIGSVNREKPFNDALRIALRGNPLRLRRIVEKLTEKAEDGDLAAIREVADRLDGRPVAQQHNAEIDGQIRITIRKIDDNIDDEMVMINAKTIEHDCDT